MARETKAQRAARVGQLCASYDAHNHEANKLAKLAKAEKELIKAEDPGTYGEWILARGTAREITDMDAIKAHYAGLNLELPTRLSDAPIVVSPVAGR